MAMNSTDEDDRMITAGIDVGSAVLKVAIMETPPDGAARLLAGEHERVRRRDPLEVAEGLYRAVLAKADVPPEAVAYVATTGEGEQVPFRTGHFYGMTTHARGGLFLEPAARLVLDIGALHTRAMAVDPHGKVLGYRMTSQCASGSGQFLENIARYLGVSIEDVGPLSQQADQPEACSSICAVLAETDVINMVSRGISLPNILKGIHQSMAGRALRLVTSLAVPGILVVTGGLAADEGLMAAMRETAAGQRGATEVRHHPQSVLAGAIGAGIWGALRARKLRLGDTRRAS